MTEVAKLRNAGTFLSNLRFLLESLITSKTRIKLLVRLFLNPNTKGYLRGLAEEFSESTNSVRIELNRLEAAGMLSSELSGNRKLFRANTKHPLFPEIHNILKKMIGIDEIISRVLSRLGGLDSAYLTGQLAEGRDQDLIDLVLVGTEINTDYLHDLVRKGEGIIKRRIRTICMSLEEFEVWKLTWSENLLLLWQSST
ncbi:MAG: hypothetical protein ACI8ZN_002694 [Bacteroidia bacterium]